MNNYIIQYPLTHRNDSKTYVVLRIQNNEQYVLKMIECKDETHANETFREANGIRLVHHPYIGKLLESFVHYDRVGITFYFVIVMPFYRNGSCYQILRNNWVHMNKTDEESMKKMVVQVLELLTIMIKHNISHLNLKPDNIFYDHENDHLILCDFGYKSILNDKRRFIRGLNVDYLWMSPMIAASDDPSKIDVWCIGLILFAFMTTSILSESNLYEILQSNDKYNVKKLEMFIKPLYSDQLVEFTMKILNPDNSTRPSITELNSFPFYQSCFKQYSSHVIGRRNRQSITPNMKPIPFDGRPKDILNYIWVENQNELCIEEALLLFQKVCRVNIISQLPVDYAKRLTETMEINNVNGKICEYTCYCLGYLAMYSNNPSDLICSRSVIQSVINALELHGDNYRLFRYAAAYFIVLSSFQESALLIGRMKGVEIMIQALSTFIDKSSVVAIILNAIWNLCVMQQNCEIAIKFNVRIIVINIYDKHESSPEVLLNASACLLAIITSLDVTINQGNIFIMYLLLNSLKIHSGFTNLVRYTLILLENLLAMNEEHAMQFIECHSKQTSSTEPAMSYRGMQILKIIYEVHQNNSVIMLCICNVILRVVMYEDLVDTIIDLMELSTFIGDVKLRFRHSKRLISCINFINQKIATQLRYLHLQV